MHMDLEKQTEVARKNWEFSTGQKLLKRKRRNIFVRLMHGLLPFLFKYSKTRSKTK